MAISCTCDHLSEDDVAWFYSTDSKHQKYPPQRRKRCFCCKTLINPNDTVGRFSRWRNPRSDIEERIYGDDVPLADFFMCEQCFDLHISIEEAGYCVIVDEGISMKESWQTFLKENQ